MNAVPDKVVVRGVLVKLLHHRRDDRGMTVIPEASRCVRVGEVHELVTTDHRDLVAGSRVNRVGFLGFAEIGNAGVLEVGDRVLLGEREVGVLVGFDDCHFPNHYNVLIETPETLTAEAAGAEVGAVVTFAPPARRTP